MSGFGEVEPGSTIIEFILERHAIAPQGETICIPMTWSCEYQSNGHKQERVMNSRISDSSEGIDRKTSRSICDAVGERLQQDLRPEFMRPSSHLEHLMDELRRRDDDGSQRVPN
jgi:hypothetical protein